MWSTWSYKKVNWYYRIWIYNDIPNLRYLHYIYCWVRI